MESLVSELDKNLEEFIEERIRNSQNQPRYCNFDGMTTDEIAEEMKQHPAFMTEFDESKPLTPALEALQILKYESPSNDENAVSYKEDGNKNFERKKYRWAIDNYTAGLDCKPCDKQLVAVLYTNRAASHFYIGNYRSSLNDCMSALKNSPHHMKAWIRALRCYVKLEKHSEAITWCDKAMSLFPEEKEFVEAQHKSEQQQKKLERDERMAKAKERKMTAEKQKIVDAIKSRKIRAFSMKRGVTGLTDDEWIELVSEEYEGSKVQLIADSSGQFLSWPVLFLYPEHNQSDFIVGFHENARFSDQLQVMFGNDSQPAGWDEGEQYKPESIEILYEERKSKDECTLHEVDPKLRLIDILQSKKFRLCHSTITFFLLVKNSDYKKTFIENYGK